MADAGVRGGNEEAAVTEPEAGGDTIGETELLEPAGTPREACKKAKEWCSVTIAGGAGKLEREACLGRHSES